MEMKELVQELCSEIRDLKEEISYLNTKIHQKDCDLTYHQQELDKLRVEVNRKHSEMIKDAALMSEEDAKLLMHPSGKGDKINRIKLYRKVTGAGLKESKEAIDKHDNDWE